MNFPRYHDDDEDDGPRFVPDMAAMHAWNLRFAEMQMAERHAVIRWAPLLCRCERRFDWRSYGPPQADCPVHGVLAFNPLTGEMI